MNELAEEAARLVDAMPEDKARSVLDYARYMADTADQEAWVAMTSNPRYRPKLEALVAEADRLIAAGLDEPLDPELL